VQGNTGAIRYGSRTAKTLWASLQRVRREHGADASAEIIAKELNLDLEEVRELLPAINAHATSIDMPIGDADGATFGDIIPSGNIGQSEAMERTETGQLLLHALNDFTDTLNDRHADVFHRRILADYLGAEKASPDEFGVTKQRISQIESAVTKKLRVFLVERFGVDNLKEMMQ
jgi:DNA-directed RNA polymerase sigma subunit (sigma70/sigma32)